MIVRLRDTAHPYADIIQDAIAMSFPVRDSLTDRQVVDAVLAEVIATSKIRFGPAPILDSQYLMKQVVCKAVADHRPIPILCPYGTMKPDKAPYPDVADVMALKMLRCLHQRIKRYYAPGTLIKMRIEDLGGYWLFRSLGPHQREINDDYTDAMENLVSALELDQFVMADRESEIVSEQEYIEDCERTTPHILEYLEASEEDDGVVNADEHLAALEGLGWKGTIPLIQRLFYYSRYQKHYGVDRLEARRMLADYFAGSLARYRLGCVGYEGTFEKDDYIQLNFANPVPGAPADLANRIIHYHTIHGKYTKDHMPPWRAIGYLRIFNDNSVRPAVVGVKNGLDLQDCIVTIENGDGLQVDVNMRYVLMD